MTHGGSPRGRACSGWSKRACSSRPRTTDHAVGTCYRCGTAIEPLLSLQWFMDMKRLVQARHRSGGGRPGAFRARRAGARSTSIGWRASAPGASAGSCGGGTASRPTICEECEHLMVAAAPPAACEKCGGPAAARGGRARHLVQFGPVAVRHTGLAGGDPEARGLLSHLGALHGARHHLSVGGPHDHDGHRVHGRRALQRRHHPSRRCWPPTAGA